MTFDGWPRAALDFYRGLEVDNSKAYWLAHHATLSSGGYVQLSARGLAAGAGYHRLAPDQLARYRMAVDNEKSGEDLRARIIAVEAHGIEITVRDALKTVPRGYPKEHQRAELLKNKDLAAWTEWGTADWVHSSAAKEHVLGFLRDARPLTQWLDAQVGPTLTR